MEEQWELYNEDVKASGEKRKQMGPPDTSRDKVKKTSTKARFELHGSPSARKATTKEDILTRINKLEYKVS